MKAAAARQSVKSMTGYAEARRESDAWLVRVGLRSVNHRFLDLRLRLPEGLESFEPPIRQLLRARLRRGHVEMTLHVEPARGAAVQVNREIAAAYLRVVEDLRREFNLTQEPDLAALLRLPGVVAAAGAAGGPLGSFGDEAAERLRQQVTACLEQAVVHLEEMRQAEGRSLSEEMQRLLAAVQDRTAQMQVLIERSGPAYALRLKMRLQELLAGAPMDPARLAQEAALLAERADVNEELARLQSHLEQFGRLVAGAGEIGKRLDFLLQEMQREANTLLSKTPGLGPEGLAITELGLQIKAEIEKLREQVQNVE
ncbi:MAG TPA: YicC/YloC family endoribonuclease [Candidatus Acidoferrales bacterium]